MIRPVASHLGNHRHFYLALAAGLAAWLASWKLQMPLPQVIGGDVFFAVFLGLISGVIRCATAPELRRRAEYDDEGVLVIMLITAFAIALSLGAIFTLLDQDKPPKWHLVLALSSVPLGWVTLHTIMALHYARRFYGQDRKGKAGKPEDAGGLGFPGTEEPLGWDFMYYSFVVGMTAQVSDVNVSSKSMRKVTLAHGVVSFLFNTVILALAVNVAVGQSGK